MPHPKGWKADHPCIDIKPFYFHKQHDTLYLSKASSEWIGYAWARADAIWTKNLFPGWKHVGLDFRSPSWIGRTPGYAKAPLETVFSRHPTTNFRQVFPDLEALTVVLDLR